MDSRLGQSMAGRAAWPSPCIPASPCRILKSHKLESHELRLPKLTPPVSVLQALRIYLDASSVVTVTRPVRGSIMAHALSLSWVNKMLPPLLPPSG